MKTTILFNEEYSISDLESDYFLKIAKAFNFYDHKLKIEVVEYNIDNDLSIDFKALWYYDGTGYTFNEPTFNKTIFENLENWKEQYNNWIIDTLKEWKNMIVTDQLDWIKESILNNGE